MRRSIKNGTVMVSTMLVALSCLALQPSFAAQGKPVGPKRFAALRAVVSGKVARDISFQSALSQVK